MRSPAAAFDLRAALSEEIRAALDAVSGAEVRPKAIHRCRVRLKRARALARVGRSCAPGLAAVFNESARAIMHELAHARDLAALAECARTNAGKVRAKNNAAALVALADALDTECAQVPPPDTRSVQIGLRDLLAMAQVWPEASPRQIAKGAECIVRRARQAHRRGRGSSLPANRHAWRKREKERFYATSLLGSNWPHGRKRRRKQSERLGEILGRERDLLLLLERLAHEPTVTPRRAARARNALKQRLKRVSASADRLGAKLHAGNT